MSQLWRISYDARQGGPSPPPHILQAGCAPLRIAINPVPPVFPLCQVCRFWTGNSAALKFRPAQPIYEA